MQPDPTIHRQLSAIFFADIVGFTSFMQANERDTLSKLSRYQEVLADNVSKNGGEIFQSYGDGTLCMFSSALAAIECAKNFQLELRQEPVVPVRVGIHIGDIIKKDNTIYGDAVNLASRVESLGVPHSVLFTEKVASELKSHPEYTMHNLGPFLFKNVASTMDVYALTNDELPIPSRKNMKGKLSSQKPSGITSIQLILIIALIIIALLVVNKQGILTFGKSTDSINVNEAGLSLAILPFNQLNNFEKEDEFLADGIMEEILIRLQKSSNIRTISRTSVLPYKNNPKAITFVGKELNVGYILEASIRKTIDQVLINASLFSVENDKEEKVWSEEFTTEIKTQNLFELQSQIADKIVTTLNATFIPTAHEIINITPTQNIEAYNRYLRGNFYYNRQVFYSDENTLKALDQFQKAVELDNDFALAHIKIAACNRFLYWFNFDRSDQKILEAKASLGQALIINAEIPEARIEQAWQYYHFEKDYERALALLQTIQESFPNYAELYWVKSNILKRKGDFEGALESIEFLLTLNPKSPIILMDAAQICSFKQKFEQSERYLLEWLNIAPDDPFAYSLMARLQMMWKWDLKGAIRILTQENINQDSFHKYMLYLLYLKSGEFSKSHKIVNASEGDVFFQDQERILSKDLALANIYFAQGKELEQKQAASRAIKASQARLKILPEDHRGHAEAALAFALSGDKKNALDHAQSAANLVPIGTNAIMGYFGQVRLLEIYVINQQYEEALKQLRLIFSYDGPLTGIMVQNDPFYAPLKSISGFDELVN